MKYRSFQIWLLISVILIVSLACSLGSVERFGSSELPGETAPATQVYNPEATSKEEITDADQTQTSTPTQNSVLDGIVEGLLPTTKVNPVDGALLVYVAEGEFLMGSEDEDAWDFEKPEHLVYLDAFWIYQHEVSNAQFAAFVDARGHQTTAEESGWGNVFDGRLWKYMDGAYWGAPEGPGSNVANRGDHPVVLVSWFDAVAYCEWAGGRLPTEAEWEKAARGTERRKYPWGDQSPACTLVNYGACNVLEPSPVGNYPSGASPYGVFDMAGNVWEWVADWYAEDYYSHSPYENPTGPANGESRVLRGGSYYDSVRTLRVAQRFWSRPNSLFDHFGFRCLHSP